MLTSCNRTENEINSLQQQVWKNPRNASAYMRLGNACARARRYSEASAAYKSALAINPELDEEQKLHTGSNLVLVSFGAGYTWGGIYIKWQ